MTCACAWAACVVAVQGGLCESAGPTVGAPELISRGRAGGGNGDSRALAITPDGRSVLLETDASNLVPRDGNAVADVLLARVRNNSSRRPRYRRLSIGEHRREGEAPSYGGGMSGDLTTVVFGSESGDLVCLGANLSPGVYVLRDDLGTKERLSLSYDASGTRAFVGDGACVSTDGRYVVCESSAGVEALGVPPGVSQVYVVDLQLPGIFPVSLDVAGSGGGNNYSGLARMSPNGRFVSYLSHATNLVLDDSNGHVDVFVLDRDTGVTNRVSESSGGVAGNARSDGSAVSDTGLVVFSSDANNLVDGDTNGMYDVFLHDVATGETTLVSAAPGGAAADQWSSFPSISGDGTTVVFTSAAENLVAGDGNGKTDVFAYDVATGALRLISCDALGNPGDGDSKCPAGALSQDGTWCVFDSEATNLVKRDRNGPICDVFRVRLK